MRKIEIIDDVRLRFPGRDSEFDIGIEVGAASVLMAQGALVTDRLTGDTMQVSLLPWTRKPLLRVVS
jgi:hypothetical protein